MIEQAENTNKNVSKYGQSNHIHGFELENVE
jgi:hypothetical protein